MFIIVKLFFYLIYVFVRDGPTNYSFYLLSQQAYSLCFSLTEKCKSQYCNSDALIFLGLPQYKRYRKGVTYMLSLDLLSNFQINSNLIKIAKVDMWSIMSCVTEVQEMSNLNLLFGHLLKGLQKLTALFLKRLTTQISI